MKEISTQQAVARAIEVHMVRSRITQADLAGRVGMSPSALSKRMTGAIALDVDEVERIAVALGLDPFELMDLARHERLGREAA